MRAAAEGKRPGASTRCGGKVTAGSGDAQAYDGALVRTRGTNAATNFTLSDYRAELAAFYAVQKARARARGLLVLLSACTRRALRGATRA